MAGAGQIVTGPVATPPSDGLRAARGLGVIENPPDPDDPNGNWIRGYKFVYDACHAGFTRDPCNNTEAMPTIRGFGGKRRIDPFNVVVGRVCGTWGWEAQDYVADAVRLLDAYQYGIIARELWRGDQAQASLWTNPDPGPEETQIGNPFLAWHLDPQFVDIIAAEGGDPLIDTVPLIEALALLEQFIASCSGSSNGIIHATRRMASLWTRENMLSREGGRLFTHLGTQVIADAAYDGSGPTMDGPSPSDPIISGTPASFDREWAYVTGPITLRIQTGPPTLTPNGGALVEAMNRGDNDVTYYASRLASPSWGCCHGAIAIDTGFTFIDESSTSGDIPDDVLLRLS